MKEHENSPLSRVFEAAECKSQTELAELLGIKQSSVSDAKRRGAVPPEWLLTLFHKKGINPEWIKTGSGSKRLGQDGASETRVVVRPPAGCTIEELVAEIIRRALK
ncbi:helix-turn-helix domain-containing protein [uncultured Desulfovibrio sp.]|uniref:helix-turn-helix domain-containing protein n=1 Tax=uncultured Desulfovibrio sp. TaxID=167968 RepID=UPI0026720061|nr:helix-turn-helix domain-containing protein [uncultured Desulfovibrio sp.]